MSIGQLRSRIESAVRAAGPSGDLTIDARFLGNPRIAALIDKFYLGHPIVVRGARLESSEPAAKDVVVRGETSFLGVENAPVAVSFRQGDADVELRLSYELPATWKFSQSFPSLPVSMDFRTEFGAARESYLDMLTFLRARFVLSTEAHADVRHGVALAEGLSFVAELRLNGVLGAIERTLGGGGPIVVHGPIIPAPPMLAQFTPPTIPEIPGRSREPLVGINLRATTEVDLQAGALELKRVYLQIYSPPDAAWLERYPAFPPGMFVGGELRCGDVVVDAAGQILPGASSMQISAFVDGAELSSLGALAPLVGGDDFANELAPLARPLGKLGLEALAVSFFPETGEIDAVLATVGLRDLDWDVVEGRLRVDRLSARFTVMRPFGPNRQVSTMLTGGAEIAGVRTAVVVMLPEMFVNADVRPEADLPLRSLMERYAPGVPPPSDLRVDRIWLAAQPGKFLSLRAMLADEPRPFTLPLGAHELALRKAQVMIEYAVGSGVSAGFSGWLSIGGAELAVSTAIPGPFSLRGRLPGTSLRKVLAELCDGDLPLPDDFDVAFESAQVRIEKSAGDATFALAAQAADVGTVALQVSRHAGKPGFAAAIALSSGWKLSRLYGALAPFDALFRFEKSTLVIATMRDTAFTFPDLAAFNDPALTSTRITLPEDATGVVPGINFYAQIALSGDRALELVRDALHVAEATLDVVLQIGVRPFSAMLSANLRGELAEGVEFRGALRAKLGPQQVALELLGEVGLTVHGRPLLFTAKGSVGPTGVMCSGTMQGVWTDAFGLSGLTLADAAIVLGVSTALLPTFGLAARIEFGGIRGSGAILIDAQMPSRSLLAASISDLDLAQVVGTIAGPSTPLPAGFSSLLSKFALSGIPLTDVPFEFGPDLDAGRVGTALAQALNASGKVALPGDLAELALTATRPGAEWTLTDRTTLKHYTLRRQGDRLAVALAVQFYCAPQPTMIGQLEFPRGFRLSAAVKLFGLEGSVLVEADPGVGIFVQGRVRPFGVDPVLSVGGRGGEGDVVFDLATYDAPAAAIRGPHCVFRCSVTLLGLTREVDLKVTSDSFEFELTDKLFNVFTATLRLRAPIGDFAKASFLVAGSMQNDLFEYLKENGTREIAKAAAAATESISEAQARVNDAQRRVDELLAQIGPQRRIIEAERAEHSAKVVEAQNKVASIQGTIDYNWGIIHRLEAELAALKAQDVLWPPWTSVKIKAQIAAKGAETTPYYTAIGFEKGALATAHGVLEGARGLVATFPIDADPRVSGLYAAHGIATGALQASIGVLEGAKAAVKGWAAANDWILRNGLPNLLNVRSASFSVELSALDGGAVSLALDMTLMAVDYKFDLNVDLKSAQRIGELLVAECKRLIGA